MPAGEQVYSIGVFCGARAVVSIKSSKIGQRNLHLNMPNRMRGHVENHSTGSPQCIIDYIETEHTKLSVYQQAQREHSIKDHYNYFIFLIRISFSYM